MRVFNLSMVKYRDSVDPPIKGMSKTSNKDLCEEKTCSQQSCVAAQELVLLLNYICFLLTLSMVSRLYVLITGQTGKYLARGHGAWSERYDPGPNIFLSGAT